VSAQRIQSITTITAPSGCPLQSFVRGRQKDLRLHPSRMLLQKDFVLIDEARGITIIL